MIPKVTVIVPVYKAERFLEKCVESILNQTLKFIEIILVDDGSPDNSGLICDQYAKKDRRIKVIHQNNAGPGAARNNGIKSAVGEYIGFVDSDDYIEPQMYEKMYASGKANQANIIVCNYVDKHIYDLTENVVEHPFEEGILYDRSRLKNEIIPMFADSRNYGFFSLWNKLYERKWILNTGILIDERISYGEDFWFNIFAFDKAERVVALREAFYNYVHINKESLMLKYRADHLNLMINSEERFVRFISQYDISKYKLEFNKRFTMTMFSLFVRELKNNTNSNQAKEKILRIIKKQIFIDNATYMKNYPIHIRLICFFISRKNFETAFLLVKLWSIMKI